MKRLHKVIAMMILALLFIALSELAPVKAQSDTGWTPPFLISSGQGDGSEATLITDSYGYIHAFWTELLPSQQTLLMYSRFDGDNWTVPTDIYVTKPFIPIKNVTASIAPDGMLYVMWPEGDNGPLFFTRAALPKTLSAQDWESPYRVDAQGNIVELIIDSQGVFHAMLTRISGLERGVFYTRSEDRGVTWSDPFWLDPDILADHIPSNMSFVIDEEDGLHATWFYFSTEFGGGGDWVRYAHSLDGGKTWPEPFTIDRLDEAEMAADEKLSNAAPILAVQGRNVHVIWAGGKLHYRHHRFSDDRGLSWSQPVQIMGELNGAAGDGIAVDGAGRLHFFSQVRFPQAIYHTVWDQNSWSKPTLIYLIRYSDEDEIGDHVHAHGTHPAFRAGNQLVLTFADPPPEPGRRLYFMQTTLTDVPESSLEPTPTVTPMPTVEVTSTPTPLPATPAPSFGGPMPPTGVARPDRAVWLGIAPVVLLLLAAFSVLYLRSSKAR